MREIVRPSGLDEHCCVVIPVQELEAWILADLASASNVFKSWKPKPINNPETISDPKEHLIKLSLAENNKPRYSHALHNERLAKYIDLKTVAMKCPSFRTLEKFVTTAMPADPPPE